MLLLCACALPCAKGLGCSAASDVLARGLHKGGACAYCLPFGAQQDYRLYIFFPDTNGGCIMGKNFFYFLFFVLSGQYNLEINSTFRNTVKNTFHPRLSIRFKNFYILFLFRSDDLQHRPRASQKRKQRNYSSVVSSSFILLVTHINHFPSTKVV